MRLFVSFVLEVLINILSCPAFSVFTYSSYLEETWLEHNLLQSSLICDLQGNQKVLSSNDANKSGSKRSACPRFVAPSSYPLIER